MWQYLYMLPWPVLVTGVGVLTFAYGFSVQPPDWGSRLPWAAGIAAIGLVWAGYVLGMRVDVDEENVTKVYLFGLLRERIPRDALTFDVDESRDRYGWS
ncbi:MAG TPA: hypothetical protein VFL29_07135, partial [Candidatus Dormibacteraeota bacterium]|nr:hypothetical protein [Candidatus Dormibacteraeota bacterium]